MGDSDAKRQWLEKVLGVKFAGSDESGDRFPALWLGAKQRWQDAMERVDGEIGRLQGALKASGDTELGEIAEFGLNGITGNFKVRVMSAVIEVDRADATLRAGIARKALSVVEGFRGHIEADPRVLACDANPFGVSVSIRATLVPALTGLGTALSAA